MTERLMGVETEYAFVAFRQDGSLADARQAMTQIERLAERHLPHLPARSQRGIFLQNASRFYRDFGGGDAHQEMTTPECPNPWDAARYVVANEQILLGLAGELLREAPHLREALYFKHNVDYSGAHTSWGTHESYLTRTPIPALPEHLLPHLASRIIFTGAGGFNPLAPGIEFMVSPRVAHLTQAIALGTERDRPLFNTRDEPLAGGGHRRLHVICGESLSSHTSMWLRSATTALVVALTDGGLMPGKKVTLAEPVEAMRTFTRDPVCRAKVPLLAGGTISAIEIQRHYLQLAERHLPADFMPPWAPQVCQHWRAILDRLEQGAPESVARILDWAIKYFLFADRAARRGLHWDEARRGGVAGPFEKLRQELFEIDIRFGQLGERGIFAGLDRAGVLQHQFPGVNNFPHAMINPPDLGRARVRGNVIKQLSGREPRHCCDWDGVWDLTGRRWLDLSHPFAAGEEWKSINVPVPAPERNPEVNFESRLAGIEHLYERGAFEEASREILALELRLALLSAPQRGRLVRIKACVQTRRGHLDGVELLNQISDPSNLTMGQITDYLLVLRLSGLTPRPEMKTQIQAVLNGRGGRDSASLPVGFREHWGAYLLSRGRFAEAESVLESVARSRTDETRVLNRSRAILGNVKRLLGKPEDAGVLLEQARQQQRNHQFEGDLADFTLPNLAKLLSRSEPLTALALLSEAKTIQARTRNRLGLIRTLLLDARLAAWSSTTPHGNEAILALSADIPALATCRLFRRIMERWENWTHDSNVLENGDAFWGL